MVAVVGARLAGREVRVAEAAAPTTGREVQVVEVAALMTGREVRVAEAAVPTTGREVQVVQVVAPTTGREIKETSLSDTILHGRHWYACHGELFDTSHRFPIHLSALVILSFLEVFFVFLEGVRTLFTFD